MNKFSYLVALFVLTGCVGSASRIPEAGVISKHEGFVYFWHEALRTDMGMSRDDVLGTGVHLDRDLVLVQEELVRTAQPDEVGVLQERETLYVTAVNLPEKTRGRVTRVGHRQVVVEFDDGVELRFAAADPRRGRAPDSVYALDHPIEHVVYIDNRPYRIVEGAAAALMVKTNHVAEVVYRERQSAAASIAQK